MRKNIFLAFAAVAIFLSAHSLRAANAPDSALTKTGQATEYLLPKSTNVRRVFVDNSTTPVTFWVGSNHGASIVKL
jgi:hypothetical protein